MPARASTSTNDIRSLPRDDIRDGLLVPTALRAMRALLAMAQIPSRRLLCVITVAAKHARLTFCFRCPCTDAVTCLKRCILPVPLPLALILPLVAVCTRESVGRMVLLASGICSRPLHLPSDAAADGMWSPSNFSIWPANFLLYAQGQSHAHHAHHAALAAS